MAQFILVVVALLAIVPVATLCATGSWRATWEALRGYAIVLGLIWGTGLVIAALGGLAAIISS